MLRENEILLAEVKKLMELVPLVDRIYEKMNANMTVVAEQVDTAFVCREVGEILETFGKKVRALERKAHENTSLTLMITGEDNVQTEYCTATPDPRLSFKIPYKREINPAKHDEIMSAIGVSQLANEKELVRLYFPGLMDYCTQEIGECRNPPAGINPKEATGVDLRLSLRRRDREAK